MKKRSRLFGVGIVRLFFEILVAEGNFVHGEGLSSEIFKDACVGGEVETETIGIERLPCLIVTAVHIAATVFAVTEKGMTCIREGCADLMGAPRQQFYFYKGKSRGPK